MRPGKKSDGPGDGEDRGAAGKTGGREAEEEGGRGNESCEGGHRIKKEDEKMKEKEWLREMEVASTLISVACP